MHYFVALCVAYPSNGPGNPRYKLIHVDNTVSASQHARDGCCVIVAITVHCKGVYRVYRVVFCYASQDLAGSAAGRIANTVPFVRTCIMIARPTAGRHKERRHLPGITR